MTDPHANEQVTDTERLDFIEMWLAREGQIQTPDGHFTKVRTWSVVTAAGDSLRDTIDTLMTQRGKLQNG